MADKAKTDWDMGLSLFVQRLTYPQIAQKLGVTKECVRQHAYRHSWARLRTQTAVEPLQPSGEPLTRAEQTLVEKSRRVREAIAADVIESTKLLSKMRQSSNPRAFRERQSAVAELTGVASEVFNWRVADQGMVRVSVIESATLKPLPLPEPAIDVVVSAPEPPADGA